MKVSDYDAVFAPLIPEDRRGNTYDGLVAGDLDRDVRNVGVTWMATLRVLREAVAAGVDLLITHDSTFYSEHPGDDEPELRALPAAVEKTRLLEESGMALYRVRDAWEEFPRHGILDAWVDAIGGLTPAGKRLYRVERTTFRALVGRLKRVQGVPVMLAGGDPDVEIETVLVSPDSQGRWAALDAVATGADAMIGAEVFEWEAMRILEAAGIPVAVTGHALTENHGMRRMVDFLRERLPGPEYTFFDAGGPFVYI